MKQWKYPRIIQSFQFFRTYSKYLSNESRWQSAIGLEVHAQINSASKLFSVATTSFDSPPNTAVALFDCAMPGTLPVLNKRCVEAGVMTAVALNCRVNPVSMFDRKHYFYSDLPAGYQITQHRLPLAVNGFLEYEVFVPGQRGAYRSQTRIKQIQLEQDSGRSLHAGEYSLIDLNRAGIPLMEIVFQPDLKDGAEAAAMLKELSLILKSLETCSCKMEEGALRVDVNVSINRSGEPLGIRTEIKNVGSIKAVSNAIDYEIGRQTEVLEHGGVVINETRAWDADTRTTVPMRDKEEKADYRYMPEPNLPFLHIGFGSVTKGAVNVHDIKKQLPELPDQKRSKLKGKYRLSPEQAYVLVNETPLLKIFISAVEGEKTDTQLLAKLLINDFTEEVNDQKLNLDKLNLNSQYFAELANLIQSRKINRNIGKKIINEILNGASKSPLEIAKERNWLQINDEDLLENICREVIAENKKAVAQYKAGKKKVFKALLGAVAAKTNQKADMAKCNEILNDLLKKLK